MANRWGNNGRSDILYFLGSEITAIGDCNHEIKSYLLLGRKNYDKPRQSIKKQRFYFVTNVHIVKAMIFPVVLCGSESWTMKKS